VNQKLLSLWLKRIELEKERNEEIINVIRNNSLRCAYLSFLLFFLFALIAKFHREEAWFAGLVIFFLVSSVFLIVSFLVSCDKLFGFSYRGWNYVPPKWELGIEQINQEIIEELKKQSETDQKKNQAKEEKNEQSISDKSAS
jgi:hypothetical protein